MKISQLLDLEEGALARRSQQRNQGVTTPAPEVDPNDPNAPIDNQDPNANQTSTTGDPTLDQPLPAQTGPKKTFAQRVGGVAKGIGAVAGGVAGAGRAIKKGFAAGANAVGGPGAAPGGAQSTQINPNGPQQGGGSAGGGDVNTHLADLEARIGKLEQQLRIARQ